MQAARRMNLNQSCLWMRIFWCVMKFSRNSSPPAMRMRTGTKNSTGI